MLSKKHNLTQKEIIGIALEDFVPKAKPRAKPSGWFTLSYLKKFSLSIEKKTAYGGKLRNQLSNEGVKLLYKLFEPLVKKMDAAKSSLAVAQPLIDKVSEDDSYIFGGRKFKSGRAVIEYLMTDILEMADYSSIDRGQDAIEADDIANVIYNDESLSAFISLISAPNRKFLEEFRKGMTNPFRTPEERMKHLDNMPKIRKAAIKKFLK